MNEALKEIANKYQVPEERIPEILTGMKVKNPEKPSKRQLEGFERVCALIKEGKPTEEALAIVVNEAKNRTKESQTELLRDDELDEFIIEQANRAADATLFNLPQVAFEENQRLKEAFVRRYRERIAERLSDPEFKQQFVAAIEGTEMGKLNSFNSTPSNIALPSSSSSSS